MATSFFNKSKTLWGIGPAKTTLPPTPSEIEDPNPLIGNNKDASKIE